MNTRKEHKTEENCLDILLNELPVEKVDMNELLRKYVSLLIMSYGEDVATEKLKGLIDDEEERQMIMDEARNRKMVLLNKKNMLY